MKEQKKEAIIAPQKVDQTTLKQLERTTTTQNVAHCNQLSKSSTLPSFLFLVVNFFARKIVELDFMLEKGKLNLFK